MCTAQSPSIATESVRTTQFPCCFCIRFNRPIVVFTVVAAAVASCQAPPAIVLLQLLQCQIPTACRFTLVFPQKEHKYFARCCVSIFLTSFRKLAPYRVPYFPEMPTFFVRRAISQIFRTRACASSRRTASRTSRKCRPSSCAEPLLKSREPGLPQARAVPRPVLPGNADLLRAPSHCSNLANQGF